MRGDEEMPVTVIERMGLIEIDELTVAWNDSYGR